jgi:hypothetical protein
MKGALPFIFALLLCACEPGTQPEPIMLEPNSDLLGVWEYQFDESGDGTHTDQFLLVFHQDSTVDYKRCSNRTGEDAERHSYRTMSGARILEVKPHAIRIGIKLFITFDTELKFERFPYSENGDAFIVVDDIRLRRLKPGESSNHASWKCSDDDNRQESKRSLRA